MNAEHPDMLALASEIARTESKLQELEWEIDEVGLPAGTELKRRLEALKIEEAAVLRNLKHLCGIDPDDGGRRRKQVEALLDHIRREEESLGRDTAFLHQSGLSSPELAARAAARTLELILLALKRALHDHHPLGMSVFVNHSHRTLAERYGLADPDERG